VYANLFDQARHADDIRRRIAESAFGNALETAGGDKWRTSDAEARAEVVQLAQ
jgi:hypothetical protein